MRSQWIVLLLLAALSLTAFGDSIDDAEAKRRGVPVAQVQAENALAAEKRKTADLETQVAALKKQLDDARKGAPASNPASTGPATFAPGAATRAAPPSAAIPESVPAGVLRADDLLARFPANVPPKGTKIVVQGRYVFSRLGDALPLVHLANGGSVLSFMVYIYVMGTTQDRNNPVHLTCLLDPRGKMKGIHYGDGVRVSGTVGDIDPQSGKVELTQCDALEIVPLPPKSLDAQIVGNWWAQYPPPAWFRGEFQFKPDHTMTATFSNQKEGSLTLAGKWQPNPNGPANKLRLILDKIDQPVDVDVVDGHLHVPSILPLYYFPDPNAFADFQPHDGPPLKASLAQAQNQLLQWVRTNCLAAQQATVLSAASKLFSDAAPRKGNFSLTLDGQLTHSRKMTELCVSEDELFVFEYTDAQAQTSGIAAGATRSVVRGEDYTVGDNAMKVESITLEHGNSLDATAPIKGKAVVRAITQGGIGGHNLIMVCGGKREEIGFPGGASLDNMTVDFSFQPLTRNKNDDAAQKHFGNQLVICFFMSTNILERDSNVVAQLVDVNY